MRFCGEITRGREKSVKLSLGDFWWGVMAATARLSPQSPVTLHYRRTGRAATLVDADAVEAVTHRIIRIGAFNFLQ